MPPTPARSAVPGWTCGAGGRAGLGALTLKQKCEDTGQKNV